MTTTVKPKLDKTRVVGRKIQLSELRKLNYDTVIDLYRQRAKAIASEAQGIERYIYQLFGSNLIGSIALALDPWAKFRFSGIFVTPANRVRYFVSNLYQTRKNKIRTENWKTSTSPDLSTPEVDFLPPVTTYTVSESQYSLTAFPQLIGSISDTTARTRPLNSPVGEFEFFYPHYSSVGFSMPYLNWNDIRQWYGPGWPNWAEQKTVNTLYGVGPNFRTTKSSVDLLLPLIRSQALSVLESKVSGMVTKCLPSSRKYRMTYQIGELHDAPQTVRDLVVYWKEFQNLVGGKKAFQLLLKNKDLWRDEKLRALFRSYFHRPDLDIKSIANHWLAFQFGWSSTYQAVTSFIGKPSKVAQQVNYLIERNGRDTTFRTGYKYTEPSSLFPAFVDDWLYFPYTAGLMKVGGTRDVEIRCTVNSTIKFPKIDPPKLRRELYLRKLGFGTGPSGRTGYLPSPSDIYDLIPWTWLIDWYSGLGDYLHLMDAIVSDTSIINYGFMTYKSHDSIQITRPITSKSSKSQKYNNVSVSKTTHPVSLKTDTFSLSYQLRKDVTALSEFESYTSGGISPFQASILGALFTKFI